MSDETKIETTDRLRVEGLWDEASIYRNERCIQYRNSGMTKKEAGEKAWDDMWLKYPPPGVEPVEHPDIEMPEPEEELVHIPAGDMDVARDVAWTYEHIRDEEGSSRSGSFRRCVEHVDLRSRSSTQVSGVGDEV